MGIWVIESVHEWRPHSQSRKPEDTADFINTRIFSWRRQQEIQLQLHSLTRTVCVTSFSKAATAVVCSEAKKRFDWQVDVVKDGLFEQPATKPVPSKNPAENVTSRPRCCFGPSSTQHQTHTCSDLVFFSRLSASKYVNMLIFTLLARSLNG